MDEKIIQIKKSSLKAGLIINYNITKNYVIFKKNSDYFDFNYKLYLYEEGIF